MEQEADARECSFTPTKQTQQAPKSPFMWNCNSIEHWQCNNQVCLLWSRPPVTLCLHITDVKPGRKLSRNLEDAIFVYGKATSVDNVVHPLFVASVVASITRPYVPAWTKVILNDAILVIFRYQASSRTVPEIPMQYVHGFTDTNTPANGKAVALWSSRLSMPSCLCGGEGYYGYRKSTHICDQQSQAHPSTAN